MFAGRDDEVVRDATTSEVRDRLEEVFRRVASLRMALITIAESTETRCISGVMTGSQSGGSEVSIEVKKISSTVRGASAEIRESRSSKIA